MSKIGRAGAVGTIVVATVVAVLLVQAAIARISSPATVVAANGGLHQTKVVRSNDASSDTTAEWVDVADMEVRVKAPSRSLILVTFSAESDCLDLGDVGWCSVRARIGGKIDEPNERISYAWQSATGAHPYAALAMTRSRIVGAGTHRVGVQMNANGHEFRLDDMSMVVQVIDV